MKKITFFLLLLLLIPFTGFSQEELPKVAFLGTFHFGETNDMNRLEADNLMTEKRQKELDVLSEKLAAFKPTKIMVEWEPVHYDRVNNELQQYLEGQLSLKNLEVHQIAFRVAKKSGLKEILPIDHKLELGDSEMMQYLNENEKMPEFQNLMGQVQQYLQEESAFLKSHSITEFYSRSNSEETDNFNRNMYLEVLPKLSKEPGNPLLAYTGNWYKRNIFIMGNIDSHLEPGDRVLILIGNAHRAILKEFYRNRNEVEYIEISDYLK
ncbi:DUF5694 domain-containing protein [Gramella jeungdoensis]|uniref:DUF5694 domain-containing protein n=1 Tax=Gramella jeungdoensis TaxID=708091 RepID=A0ABT0Z0K0_9FLAO|nr:DUF5694 domain-containing protein [Gramella jeungdoensis]MCM8569257.1 DUF5694 domain-containing protein [Gramella jeungdoensis]